MSEFLTFNFFPSLGHYSIICNEMPHLKFYFPLFEDLDACFLGFLSYTHRCMGTKHSDTCINPAQRHVCVWLYQNTINWILKLFTAPFWLFTFFPTPHHSMHTHIQFYCAAIRQLRDIQSVLSILLMRFEWNARHFCLWPFVSE